MSTPDQPGPDGRDAVPPVPPVPPVDPVAPPSPAPASSGWGDTPRYGQYGQQPQYGQPQYGQSQPGPPQYGQYGQGAPVPQQPAPAPYGWPAGAPYQPAATKPGIVPLRPLTLGEIYDGAFGAVRHNPAVMLGLATLVLLIATVVGVLVGQLLVPAFTSVFGPLFDDPVFQETGVTAGSIAQLYGVASGMGLTTLLAGPIVNGILTVSVSRSVLGDKVPVRQVWERVAPRAWLLVGWSLLQGFALIVLAAVLVLVVSLVVVAVSEVSGGAAAALAIALALGAVGVLAWIAIRLLLVPPALALEGARLWATVRRAWLLTRGSFWRTLGIYLLASVIVGVISQVVSVPLTFVGGALAGTGDPASVTGTLLIVSIIAGVVAAAIQTIFLAGVTALLYIDLRMRREGLDVQLTASAAERRG